MIESQSWKMRVMLVEEGQDFAYLDINNLFLKVLYDILVAKLVTCGLSMPLLVLAG